MGRKSLKEVRIKEILCAFEDCLEHKGLQATTLDDIAERSGMARRMVRHYIGNREDVIALGVQHIIEKFTTAIEDLLSQATQVKRFELAMDYIFSEQFNEHPSTKHVAALLPVSLYDDQVGTAVKSIYNTFMEGLIKEIAIHKPYASQADIHSAAYTIMCLSFGGGWMRNIGFDHELNKQNKAIARKLVENL